MLFAGCQGMGFNLLTPPVGEDICLSKPPETTSYLCDAATKAGVSLNSVDSLLLDSSAVAVVLSKTDIAKVAVYLTKIDGYLNLDALTYEFLISQMQIDAAQATVLKSILARHIAIFNSPQVISNYDLTLIRLHIAHQKAQFGL